MTKHSCVLLFLGALCGVPLVGCYAEARPVPADETVYEAEPPPPPVAEVEVVPAAPGPEFFWVPGYHRWNGRQYVWIRGRYERRPHARAHWVPSHWVVRGRSHVWVEGRWE
jgi:hypothetical protein